MDKTEKKLLKQLGDGKRVDCLARLGEQLQIADDRDQQNHVLNAIAKVCSFGTDAMFRVYIEELRKEDDGGTPDEV